MEKLRALRALNGTSADYVRFGISSTLQRIEDAIAEAGSIRTDVLSTDQLCGTPSEENEEPYGDEDGITQIEFEEGYELPALTPVSNTAIPLSFVAVMDSIGASADRTTLLLAETQRLRAQLYSDLQNEQQAVGDDGEDGNANDEAKCPPCDDFTISRLYRSLAPTLSSQAATPPSYRSASTSAESRHFGILRSLKSGRGIADTCPICCEVMASGSAVCEKQKEGGVSLPTAVGGNAWRAPQKRRPQSASQRPLSATQVRLTPPTTTTNKQKNVIKLICSHTFCEQCLVQWLRINGSCPTCRRLVLAEDYPVLYSHGRCRTQSVKASTEGNEIQSQSAHLPSTTTRPSSATRAIPFHQSSRPTSATQRPTARPPSARARATPPTIPVAEDVIHDYGDDEGNEEDPFIIKGTGPGSAPAVASTSAAPRPMSSALKGRQLPPRPNSALRGHSHSHLNPLGSTRHVSSPELALGVSLSHSAMYSQGSTWGRPSSATSLRIGRPLSAASTRGRSATATQPQERSPLTRVPPFSQGSGEDFSPLGLVVGTAYGLRCSSATAGRPEKYNNKKHY